MLPQTMFKKNLNKKHKKTEAISIKNSFVGLILGKILAETLVERRPAGGAPPPTRWKICVLDAVGGITPRDYANNKVIK